MLTVRAFAAVVLQSSLIVGTAQATLVERDLTDHPNASLNGPGHLTFDSEAGLEWLDWTLTTNRSFADVSSQFGESGDFVGFRYASDSEIQTLFTNLWSKPVAYPSTTNVDSSEYSDAVSLLGETRPMFSTAAVYELNDKEFFVVGALLRAGSTLSEQELLFPNGGESRVGHALVRSAVAAVPEVSQVTCFGLLSLCSLVVGRRNQSARLV